MKYQKRIIVFIDILGFTESIKKSNNDSLEVKRIHDTMHDLRDFFALSENDDEFKQAGYDTQVLQISDSLIISKLVQEPGGLFSLLQDCSFAIHRLITFGFLCRGIIKFGDLYHKDDMIFGQAFIDAYKAESKMSLPIVKFDKELFELVDFFPGDANIGSEEWEKGFIKKNLIQLNEQEYFVDYFTDFDSIIGEESGFEHYDKLRGVIVDGLKLNKDSNAYLKYLWAANEFNRTCKLYGNENIELNS
jgi:hypothetical protein